MTREFAFQRRAFFFSMGIEFPMSEVNTPLPWKLRVGEFKYWYFQRHMRKLPLKVAQKLPAKLKYWVLISVGAEVTTGDLSKEIVPEVTFMEVLDSYSKSHIIKP